MQTTSPSKLRLARVRAGLTQYQLQAETGIPQSTLSLIETGIRTPTPIEVHLLAAVLGAPPTDLFTNQVLADSHGVQARVRRGSSNRGKE